MLMRATGHTDDQGAADLGDPPPDDPLAGSVGDAIGLCHGILLGTDDHVPRGLPSDAAGAGCTGFRIASAHGLLQWLRRDSPPATHNQMRCRR